jgi:hypothetical protein
VKEGHTGRRALVALAASPAAANWSGYADTGYRFRDKRSCCEEAILAAQDRQHRELRGHRRVSRREPGELRARTVRLGQAKWRLPLHGDGDGALQMSRGARPNSFTAVALAQGRRSEAATCSAVARRSAPDGERSTGRSKQ